MRLARVLLVASCVGRAEAAPAPSAAAARADPPNLILVVSDDQGYRDWQKHDPRIRTPELVRLSREGFELTDFHATPSCSPSRAALLTGRHGVRTGVVTLMNFKPGDRRGMSRDEVTIARLLRDNGYRTGLVGKWHLSGKAGSVAGYGFDHFYGFLRGSTSYWDPKHLFRNDRPLSGVKGYSSDLFAEEAVAFIRRNRERPFLLVLALNAPHSPLFGHPDDLAHYPTGRFSPIQRHHLAAISSVDRALGRVRSALEDLELTRRSVVVFLSDNGPAAFQKAKGTLYRDGAHVPFVAWAPGRIPPGSSDELTSVMDLFPTFAAWAGVELPPGRVLDGRSLAPVFAGEPHPPLHEHLVQSWAGSYAIFDDRYRLILHGQDGHGLRPELLDLEADPHESTNLLRADYPRARPILRRLTAALTRDFRDMTGDPHWSPGLFQP